MLSMTDWKGGDGEVEEEESLRRDGGETTEEGARREAWEEARAEIALEGLLAVYSLKRIDQVQLLYRAQLVSADVAAGPESLEVALFSPDETQSVVTR